jgi:hypothetical protein
LPGLSGLALQDCDQLDCLIDKPVVRAQVADRKSFESETVPREAHVRTGGARCPPIDHGVADHCRVVWSRRGLANEVMKPGRIGFAGKWAVAAEHLRGGEMPREIEGVQDFPCGVPRLVRQHGELCPGAKNRQRIMNARVRAREFQKPAVVDREKASEGIGRRHAACRLERARDQSRRAVADHPSDGILWQWRTAVFREQRISRLREIASGIHECAVEIENDEAGQSS